MTAVIDAYVKRCGGCSLELPYTMFALRRSGSADGFQRECRRCGQERSRRRREMGAYTNAGKAEIRQAAAGRAEAVRSRGEKLCPGCEIVIEIEGFALNKSAHDGRQAYCKSCISARYGHRAAERYREILKDPVKLAVKREQQKRSYEKNPDKWWESHLLRRYGIDAATYWRMHEDQGGVCCICSRPCPSGKRLAVDHNAKTGVVRELNCGNCNRGHGFYGEDLPRMAKAQVYLARHNGDWDGLREAHRILTEALAVAP